MDPGDADPVSHPMPDHAGAHPVNTAHDLMARDDGKGRGESPLDLVQLGVTGPANRDLDPEVPGRRLRERKLGRFQRAALDRRHPG